jgi:hypothetical protein
MWGLRDESRTSRLSGLRHNTVSLRGAKRRGNPHEGAYRLGDCFATLAMTATFRRAACFTRLPCPRRVVQFANLDKDPMERHAVGSAAGRRTRGGSQGPVPRRAAQFANLDKDPMERRAVGLAAGRDAGAPTWELSPTRVVQFVNLDNDPMEHCAVGFGGKPGPRGSKHGCPHPASGAFRKSRQRPYGTPHGGLGRTGPQRCQPGAGPPGAPPRPAAGRVAQFANLGEDLCWARRYHDGAGPSRCQ